jgi:hypothetical protein
MELLELVAGEWSLTHVATSWMDALAGWMRQELEAV